MLGWLVLTLGIASSVRSAEPVWQNAEVPQALREDPNYARYAAMLIQIDLLAQPATANLPITVDLPENGLIGLKGTVPNAKIKRYVTANARRISGLPVRDFLRIGSVADDYIVPVSVGELEQDTRETVETFFPETERQISAQVTGDRVVVVNGTLGSIESKLILSQALKSQRGCRAVANLIKVEPEAATGRLRISENGALTFAASELPTIPPAPVVDIASEEKTGTVRRLTGRRQTADDDVAPGWADEQLRQEVAAQISAEADLVDADLQIDVRDGVVTLTGDVRNRETVELAVETVAAVSEVVKVVAKCKPVTIQRNFPGRRNTKTKPDKESVAEKKLLGFIPLSFGSKSNGDGPAVDNWRFRESIRKTLKKRCEGRVSSIKVKSGLNGLVIEGEVKNSRDRSFALKQIDNVVELRNVEYQFVLRVDEK
jgi:osmotically-inducible protein OsmY